MINHRPARGFEDDGAVRDRGRPAGRGAADDDQPGRRARHPGGPRARHAAAGRVRAARRHEPAGVQPRRGRSGADEPAASSSRAPPRPTRSASCPGTPRWRCTSRRARNARRRRGPDDARTSTASPPWPRPARSRSRTRSASRPTGSTAPAVGGTSFLLHVRHAMAAIQAGYARTVLITHGESGRSRVGAARLPARPRPRRSASSRRPTASLGPTTTFTIPVLRYMKEYGLTHEQLAYVAVAQRRWAAKNPRAMFRDPITVDDVLASRIVAYPFHLLECCLVTDGGGALIVTSADRAADFPKPPVHVLGTGEASETPMISQMVDFTESQAFRLAGPRRLRRGRDHRGRRRPPDDLRRVRARADLRPGGARLRGEGRGGRVHRRRQHRAGRPPAAEHQRRRPVLHPHRACTACSPSWKVYARCAAKQRLRSPARISAWWSATAACSPPRESCPGEQPR